MTEIAQTPEAVAFALLTMIRGQMSAALEMSEAEVLALYVRCLEAVRAA
jgi:hypothetical protein